MAQRNERDQAQFLRDGTLQKGFSNPMFRSELSHGCTSFKLLWYRQAS